MSDVSNPHRPVRYIKPLGPRVLVRVLKLESRSESGLYLPEGAKEEYDDALYGEVVEVARAGTAEGGEIVGENVSGVPMGARVLFPKKAGIRVPWDDELRLLEVKAVLATVEEVEPSALQ